jgi:putative membrane protein
MRKCYGSRPALAAACCAALAMVSACGSAQAGESTTARVGGVSRADRAWIAAAHQADLAEIQAGQFAESNGSNPTIRSAGAMLVRDHQAFDTKLISVAGKLKLSLPTYMTAHQTQIGDELSGEQGAAFDHTFVAAMLTGHDIMIAATRKEIARGSSPAVVALAMQALPVLLKHLKTMRAAAAVG